jgi:hypothetical protein
MSFKFQIEGIKELEAQLKELASEKTAKKILRTAATKAIRPMRRAAKEECPVDSGGLKKSIDSQVSQKGMRVNAIVGSDTAVMEDGKKGEKSASTVRAARILHLVINGHISDTGQAIPANDFLSRAAGSTQAECLGVYSDTVKQGIEDATDETKK